MIEEFASAIKKLNLSPGHSESEACTWVSFVYTVEVLSKFSGMPFDEVMNKIHFGMAGLLVEMGHQFRTADVQRDLELRRKSAEKTSNSIKGAIFEKS